MSDAAGAANGQAAVVAIYPDRAAASSAITRLRATGFSAEEVGLVATREAAAAGAAAAVASPAGDHLRNTARGILFGAVLGVLLSLEAVFLGQGGPVAEIESADEVILYGIPVGALAQPDPMTEGPSALYRDELRRGRVLVIVHASDDAVAERARRTLAETDPLDLRVCHVDLADLPAPSPAG